MIDNQIERLIRGSLGLLEPVPRLSLPAGLERILASRTIIGAQDGSSSDEINGDGSRLSATRSFKRSSQPSLPVPKSAARTSSSIAATVSAPTFGNRAAVRNPQHSGANRAQNPDHSAATPSMSTSAPRLQFHCIRLQFVPAEPARRIAPFARCRFPPGRHLLEVRTVRPHAFGEKSKANSALAS
jgi:hypothetical protein